MFKKLVPEKGPSGKHLVAEASLLDVINPTIPLADTQSNLARIAAYSVFVMLVVR